MSIQPQLMLTDYAGNKSHLILSQQPLVGHNVHPAIAKDSPKRSGTKGIKSPSQIPGQSPSLTSAEQTWKHSGISYHAIQGIFKKDFGWKPNKPHYVQQLFLDDCDERMEFCEHLLQWIDDCPGVFHNII